MEANKNMKELLSNSYLFAGNAAFIEEVYAAYLQNPDGVDERWRAYFDSLKEKGDGQGPDTDHSTIRESFAREGQHSRRLTAEHFNRVIASVESKQVSVLQIINAYRFRGHQNADIDPLKLTPGMPLPDLLPSFHGLNDADMDAVFNTGSLAGAEQATLREIISQLRETYCGYVGAEYMHITSTSQKRWLQERLESCRAKLELTPQQRIDILERLVAAEGLEKYLHTKYVGQKRFSLEGGESLISLLDYLLQKAGAHGAKEVVLGMAHRGRLNVLVNVLGKSPATLFQEFEGRFDPSTDEGSGDVKYHQGFSSDIETPGGLIHLALSFNPSHLEIISPVVEGSVRARQHRRMDKEGKKVLPVIIHGDAAFAGQGVVMETFNMSQARGFTTGGSIHIIVNNQIGFTTSSLLDARSTFYCTEVARMVQAPILHVNGDDPEAVVFAIHLALEFRMQFGKDVVIDMVCYRRHGHSEADEPSATQPLMYKKIRQHTPVAKLYSDRLIEERVLTEEQVANIQSRYRDALDKEQNVSPHVVFDLKKRMIDWSPYLKTHWRHAVDTFVPNEVLRELGEALTTLPDGFQTHPRVARILEERFRMSRGEIDIDWGFAETMAYATLLRDGYSVRVSGQDCGRGTFFHRHAVIHDQASGESYIPLQHLFEDQPDLTVIDSLLSEEAVLGFEYGFSATEPKCLTIWEAQFGDFANNAQVVIDQFIISGQAKWGRLSGLVMFLPHGFDGQGPEHSSARLERYLQLCAEDNVQVCVPTLPAQMFHLLRRQLLRPYRRPLIVMTPKSLLRHRASTSPLSQLEEGGFRVVIDEIDDIDYSGVSRLVFCSGKVYFDLFQEREKRNMSDVVIIRIEQLYPFPEEEIREILARYVNAKTVVWCQEEPENQGSWQFIRYRLMDLLRAEQSLRFAGRPASASPAVGYLKKHTAQQRQLVEDGLTL